MKYVLVFVLLTCVLSASIKERMETAAERVQEETSTNYELPTTFEGCVDIMRNWRCPESGGDCYCEDI